MDIQYLKDYVKNYPCEKEITSEEMKEVYSLLTNYKEESNITIEEHIKNLNKKNL